MKRLFDHIDLRVRSLAEVRAFYTWFLPAIGFPGITDNRIAKVLIVAAARNIEGPMFNPEYASNYYAVFFEDPCGNRLEVCCRIAQE